MKRTTPALSKVVICDVVGLNKNIDSRQTKDTVNYCALVNKFLQLMGNEHIQLGKKNYKCTTNEQLRLANSKYDKWEQQQQQQQQHEGTKKERKKKKEEEPNSD